MWRSSGRAFTASQAFGVKRPDPLGDRVGQAAHLLIAEGFVKAGRLKVERIEPDAHSAQPLGFGLRLGDEPGAEPVAACVFGYGEIGNALKAGAAENTPYQDWIDTYSGSEYQDVCANVGSMIDKAVAARLGEQPDKYPRWGKLCGRFKTATQLEVGFWDMGLRGT